MREEATYWSAVVVRGIIETVVYLLIALTAAALMMTFIYVVILAGRSLT